MASAPRRSVAGDSPVASIRDRLRRSAGTVPPWLAALGLYAAIVVVLWAPFGWRVAGLVEEWDLMRLVDSGKQLWWLTAGGALPQAQLRPLLGVPFALAYSLGGGFVWLNTLTGAAFALRGLATFMLVDRLMPGRRGVGVLAGTLAMTLP